jgi:hypothetical protein
VVAAFEHSPAGSEQALQCAITAIFSQSRHAALTGASLKMIVEFGLVFLPVLAYSLLATFPNCIQRYITY